MKIIGHLQAAAAWRETVEEYAPEKGAVLSDLVDMIKGAYSFQNFPNTEPGQPLLQTLAFAGGRFVGGSDTFGIGSLIMEAEGDIAVTTTTDQADMVLADLVRRLDENHGYRLKNSIKRKSYLSNIVVEFDYGFEFYIEKLAKIARVVSSKRCKNEEREFGLKRLSFGTPDLTVVSDQMTRVETSDFVIERRAGQPFEANRYFCSAPLKTADHIEVLAEIEEIARSA